MDAISFSDKEFEPNLWLFHLAHLNSKPFLYDIFIGSQLNLSKAVNGGIYLLRCLTVGQAAPRKEFLINSSVSFEPFTFPQT